MRTAARKAKSCTGPRRPHRLTDRGRHRSRNCPRVRFSPFTRVLCSRGIRIQLCGRAASRRPVNITLNSDLVARARAEDPNMSAHAVAAAVGRIARRRFEAEIAQACDAHAQYLAEYGRLGDAIRTVADDAWSPAVAGRLSSSHSWRPGSLCACRPATRHRGDNPACRARVAVIAERRGCRGVWDRRTGTRRILIRASVRFGWRQCPPAGDSGVMCFVAT